MIEEAETSDLWFKQDVVHLKPEYGVRHLTTVISTVRRLMDRSSQLSKSMERDIRLVIIKLQILLVLK